MLFQVAMLLLWLFNFPFVIVEAQSIAMPGCDHECGGVKIPYPFGMNSSCYLEESYQIDCNSNTPTIYLNDTILEVTEISVEGSITVKFPVISKNCNKTLSNDTILFDLEGSPFAFSAADNRFIAVGCNNLALLTKEESTIGGCMSICEESTSAAASTNSSCSGVNCCQTTIPSNLTFFNATLNVLNDEKDMYGCKYTSLVEQNWFKERLYTDVSVMDFVPVVLNWEILFNDSRSDNFSGLPVCDLRNSTVSTGEMIVKCSCGSGLQGNPYVDSCSDIDECQSSERCHGRDVICQNTIGSYHCVILERQKSRVKMVVLGTGIGLGLLFLVMGTWFSYKIFKRKRKEKLKKKYFKQNGGLLLQEQLSSGEVNVEKIKMFPSKELDKATDRYNVNRMLGQGGQGAVYKGMLSDGKLVAVKKSKVIDENQLRQFINEVVLLSQINHRNVVKLLGCCLETEVPLLVYELIPNGTLYQFLHDPNEEFPLTWEMRLRIATEVAGALFYLHSAASIPIYHRDIKSTNILLDEKYRAKVADFGTSRSVTIDQTHVTTRVQGTFGYLDPEYFRSSQFTDKSDVYSFGVVLVEILTGEKAVSSTRSEEEARGLVAYFLTSMENNRLLEILDPQVKVQGKKEDVMMVVDLARSCLRLNGKERPTMKEVTMVLEEIQKLHGNQKSRKDFIVTQEIEYERNEVMGPPWDVATTSTDSGLDRTRAAFSLHGLDSTRDAFSPDGRPLLNTY